MPAATPKQPRPRAWMWIAAIPLALVATAWIVLAACFPPARIRALVAGQLRHSLTRDVRFADASLVLWPPVTLAVSRPEIAEPGGFGRGSAFAAKSLELRLDLAALLGRRLHVERLHLEEPALHLVIRRDGSTNLDSLAAPPSGSGGAAPGLDLDVREFSIRGGRVLIDDLGAGRRVAFGLATRLSLLARGDGKRIATRGNTEFSDLAFGPLSAASAAELNQGLAKLVVRLEHRGTYDAVQDRLALEQLGLRLGGTTLAVQGVVDAPGPHARYSLLATGEGLELAQLLSWAGAADAAALKGISGAGRLSFHLAIVGAAAKPGAPPALPSMRGNVTLRNGAFRYAGAPAGVDGLSFSARVAPDSLEIPDAVARVAGQPLSARLLATRFADPLVDFAVRGNLDLGAIAPLLATPGTALAGHADVDVRGNGRARDPGALRLSGQARLAGVSVSSKDLPRPVEDVNGTLKFDGQGGEIQDLGARAGGSSFTLNAKASRLLALLAKPDAVPPAIVSFDFRSPNLDLAELLPVTPGAPFLPNASGGGQVHIAHLKQGRLDVKNVEARVTLAPARLESPEFSLEGYGGTVKGNAKFDLRDTRKPAYSIQTDVRNVQADAMLSAWTPARGLLKGALNTTLTFSGAGQEPADLRRTLTLIGLAALSEGQLGPGPAFEALAQFVKVPQFKEVRFHDLKLPMRIEQGRVITDAVTLSGPNGDWKLSGAVGFDGSLDYAVSVTLPPEAGAALGAKSALAAGALSDDKGRILLDLRVGGTAKSPRIAWDPRAMQDRLAGRASAALTEQRAHLEAQAKEAAQAALARRLGAPSDSAHAPSMQAVRDSLKRNAGTLLRDFFGSRKPAPPPAPAAPPAPDTTHH